MRQFKRVFYLVLLNVIVTAATMLVVLSLWENRRAPTTEAIPCATSLPVHTAQADAAVLTEIPQDTPTPLPGEILPVPTTLTVALTPYEVQPGDSLGSIATAHDLRIADLLAVNDISDPDLLSVGQVIYIPSGPLPTSTITPLPSDTPLPSPTTTRFVTAVPSPTPTATSPGDEPGVIIASVVGVGSLDGERVQLARTGEGSLSLAGWRLEDEDGNTYTFPQLTLFKGGTVNLYSRSGQNTAIDLYWGLTAPAWRSGETITLRDAQGAIRATYQVP